MDIPVDPNALLSRNALSKALTHSGYPVAESSLATYAVRGGGPIFQKFGRVPLYRWGDALEWAKSRTSRPVRSTSELGSRAGDTERVTMAEMAPAIASKVRPTGAPATTRERDDD